MGVKCVSSDRIYTTKSQARRHWRDVRGPKEGCLWYTYTVARSSRVASLVTHMKGCRHQPGDQKAVKSRVHVVRSNIPRNANKCQTSPVHRNSPLPVKRDGDQSEKNYFSKEMF